MATHDIKSWPEMFEPLEDGRRLWTLRRNDRNYRVGDILTVREWDPDREEYTGRVLRRRVVDVFKLKEPKGLLGGFCILSIRPTT